MSFSFLISVIHLGFLKQHGNSDFCSGKYLFLVKSLSLCIVHFSFAAKKMLNALQVSNGRKNLFTNYHSVPFNFISLFIFLYSYLILLIFVVDQNVYLFFSFLLIAYEL